MFTATWSLFDSEGGGRWYNVDGVVVANQETWWFGRSVVYYYRCCVDGRVFSSRRVSF